MKNTALRITIRDILWCTLAAALVAGWFVDRRSLSVPAAEYRRLKMEEEERRKVRAEFFRELRGSVEVK
jgi:hypothetical protein